MWLHGFDLPPEARDKIPTQASIQADDDRKAAKGVLKRLPPTIVGDSGKSSAHSKLIEIDNQSVYPNTSQPKVHDELESELQDQLFEATIPGEPNGRRFLPRGRIRELINEKWYLRLSTVGTAPLKLKDIEACAVTICGIESSKFEGDLLIEESSRIWDFVQEGVCDADLPPIKYQRKDNARFDLCCSRALNTPLRCFEDWKQHTKSQFAKWQWAMVAPLFAKASDGHFVSYVLSSDVILPFVSVQTTTNGGYGTVRKVEIHPDHHEFGAAEESRQTFAVKNLIHMKMGGFDKEYQQNQDLNMIYHWADASLVDYWSIFKPRPVMDMPMKLWIIKQCQGIADGLRAVHHHMGSSFRREHDIHSSSNHPASEYHGHIKPSSIFWFSKPSDINDMGTLKIFNFEPTQLETMESNSNGFATSNPMTLGPSYSPPLSTDAWTLNIKTDSYFEMVKVEGNEQMDVRIKLSVTQFIAKLHDLCEERSYLHDFLDLIQTSMLIVEKPEQGRLRLSSSEVSAKLAEIEERDPIQSTKASSPRDQQVSAMDTSPDVPEPQNLDLSEAYGKPCPVEPPLWSQLQRSADDFPDRLAIASVHQPAQLYDIASSSEYLRWSYSQLSTAVDTFAASLERLGARPGEAVATFLDNGVEFVLAFWTAHKLGCPFVPLNPRSLINQEEASHMLRVSRASIVIVQDEETSKRVDSLTLGGNAIRSRILVSDIAADSSWTTFSSLMSKGSDRSDSKKEHKGTSEDDIVAILFTSGTTSLPKAVPHTSTTLNAFCQNLSLGGRSESSIFCSVLPNNHAMGYFYTLHFMKHGAAVVYPTKTFDSVAMVKALETEKATHTALVPTTLYALLDVLESRGTPLVSSLVDVCLSGSSVTAENMRQVIHKLGSQGVSTGFGMTEGSPVWTAPKANPEDLISGEMTISGKPSLGAGVRICDPESHVLVPRGEKGEIHQNGTGLIKGYIGDVGKENFYAAEYGRIWFITGDQGIMHSDGRVSITGRYKDMINRGGENIAPAAMEAVLARFCNIQAQVVGVPCAIAGEVPVVVLADLQKTNIKAIQSTISTHMGAACVPDQVLTLKDLELDDFPKTTSGKVQKSRLAAIVRDFRVNTDSQDSEGSPKQVVKLCLLKAYFKSTGIPIEDLDMNVPAREFADSIAFMRIRDVLRKNLGQTLSIKEMADNSTIAAQIRLLEEQGVQHKPAIVIPKPSNPPTSAQMVEIFGGVSEANGMTELISKSLQSKGFDWPHDVASVIPSYDFMQMLLESKLIDTWNFAIAIRADGSSTKARLQELRYGLEKALANNPLLTSFYVVDGNKNPYYITLKPTSKLWDMCLLDHGSVKTAADVQQLAIDYPFPEHSRAPGPLFHCLIIHVEETNSAAMVMYVHHLVQDASSLRLFYEDIEHVLSHPHEQLRPHVDYKAWAESFHALRFSPAATASVNYHVERLRGIHMHKDHLYPLAPLPREAIKESPDGLDYGFDAPGLIDLKKAYPDIIAAVVLKAAMSLVNVQRTGHTHAFFNNFEAGRERFPFIPESLAALSPDAFEASDVNGPVMQIVCNMIQVPRQEAAIDLLQRLQTEQGQLTRHAHVPLRLIIDTLNGDGSHGGDTVVEVHRTQFLTWLPGVLGEYERLKVSQIGIRCAAGLVVVGGIGGRRATTYMMSMRWDVANYTREKTAEFVQDLERAVLWLTSSENWNRPVQAFLDELSASRGQVSLRSTD
ncbi:hypothetical protein FZEAL_1201 [Fusarium zealandicum]|uniref:Carrier domain-containing protein n=1 Tax=Fusarium zealandicum TaxID=1053134 RepID=A0A8H4UU24_9HYPO|nr:hypothetical protein FZEAL_1201 [Fusarium zealandicum]